MLLKDASGLSVSADYVLNTTVAIPLVKPGVLISNEATRIYSWINYLLCHIMAIFGTGANIINILCFVKQGLKDPINVSFLGLAISDFGSALMMIWSSLAFVPAFRESDLPFEPTEFQSLVSGWPHVAFTRITSWITALITLERCLCITTPLKVRSIITAKRVAIIIICLYIIIFGGLSPMYYAHRFAWIFSPERNRTILRLIYANDRAFVEQMSLSFTNVFIPFTAYLVVITCTGVLVVKLKNKAKWRMKCTAPAQSDVFLERDQKVAKMVVMISGIFIACFLPLGFTFIAMVVEPEISVDGQYKNTLFVFGGLTILLESVNSALNIFIYYHMSSRYRTVFRQLFVRGQKKKSLSK